jgi:hypothetical protein
VGVSTAAPRGEHSAKKADAGPPRAPSIPPDFRASLSKVNRARFVSNGHAGGRYEVDIYGNASGKRAALAVSGEIPVGARLVKEHFERNVPPADPATAGEKAPDKSGPIMMMEKMERGFDPEHGDWRYVVINSAGVQVEDGRVESCSGCHDDAPHDHVFRVAD